MRRQISSVDTAGHGLSVSQLVIGEKRGIEGGCRGIGIDGIKLNIETGVATVILGFFGEVRVAERSVVIEGGGGAVDFKEIEGSLGRELAKYRVGEALVVGEDLAGI